MSEILTDSLGELLGSGIPDGTHRCVTKAKVLKSKKKSNACPVVDGRERTGVYLLISYVVVDENSPVYGADDIQDMFELFPDITSDMAQNLDSESRVNIRRQITARIARFRQLGIPEADLNRIDEAALSDIACEVTTHTTESRKTGKKYINIRGVVPVQPQGEDEYVDLGDISF